MIRNARLDIDATFVRWVVKHTGLDRKEAVRQIVEAFMNRGNASYEEFDQWGVDDDGDLYVGEDPCSKQWPGGHSGSVEWLR